MTKTGWRGKKTTRKSKNYPVITCELKKISFDDCIVTCNVGDVWLRKAEKRQITKVVGEKEKCWTKSTNLLEFSRLLSSRE